MDALRIQVISDFQIDPAKKDEISERYEIYRGLEINVRTWHRQFKQANGLYAPGYDFVILGRAQKISQRGTCKTPEAAFREAHKAINKMFATQTVAKEK